MPEVIDEVEEKEEQKSPPVAGQRPVKTPLDEEPSGSGDPVELLQTPKPLETREEPDVLPTRKPLYRRPATLIIAAIFLIAGSVIGLDYWFYARSHETTDDAFIDGHIIQISPKASGYVAKIHVTDNQQVKAGDLIVELDARDYEARLLQAKAALEAGLAKQNEAQTGLSLTRATTSANVQEAKATVQRMRSTVESTRAGASSSQSRATQAASAISTAQAYLEQARAQVQSAQAKTTRTNADVERYEALYAKDEVSKQQLDQAVAAARTASAQLDAARQKVLASEAQVNEARSSHVAATETARQAQAQISSAQAGVSEALGHLAEANTAPQQIAVSQAQSQTATATTEQLRAEVEEAELELSYTKIYATADGRVTRKSVEEGALVQIGQPLLAIVPGDVWVTANFKENQIGRMAVGQAVDITVDAYPDKVFKGHVDSVQAGTGARFSLLPPENATGNYVKVVQRVPVKIVFDEPPDLKHLLAPGMSVVPEVAVR